MSTDMPHSDETLEKKTGKNWAAWRAIIDGWGGADRSHTEIAAYLVDEHKVDDWWAQAVTVGYERAIGRRQTGQRNDGTYSASVSKTINASAVDIHAALIDDARRSEWLAHGVVAYRTGSAPKSARFDDLEAGQIIAFFLNAKGDDKTSVAVQCEKFASQDDADAWKAVWKPRLNDLAKVFKR